MGRSQARSGNQTVASYSGHGSPWAAANTKRAGRPQALPRSPAGRPLDPGTGRPPRRAGSPRLSGGAEGGPHVLRAKGCPRLAPRGPRTLAGITAGLGNDLPALALAQRLRGDLGLMRFRHRSVRAGIRRATVSRSMLAFGYSDRAATTKRATHATGDLCLAGDHRLPREPESLRRSASSPRSTPDQDIREPVDKAVARHGDPFR